MPRVIGLTVLLYGRPYLASSMQSIIDAVDEYHVLYALGPSHNGGATALANPDTEEELRAIAQTVAGRKLRWVHGTWKYEFQQRNAIYALAPGADIILVADYDECWSDGLAAEAIDYAQHSTANLIRLPFYHFWRSFKRGFMHDPAYPARLINTQKKGDTATLFTDKRIFHSGYAIPVEYMRYKWSGIHGHQSELRRDCDWLNDVYVANRQVDCHPCGSEYWNVENIPAAILPTPLRYHPYASLDLIE